MMRQLWDLPMDAQIIMLQSSVYEEHQKGSLLINEIFGKLHMLCEKKPIHLLIMGRRHPGFERTLSDRFPVTVTGYIGNRKLLATLYASADLFLLPSVSETLANTALESLACGTPVFCFDIGGMRDVVKDGETGYAVPMGSIEELVTKIRTFLSSESDRQRMSTRARELIVNSFTAEQEVQNLVTLYRELIVGVAPHGDS